MAAKQDFTAQEWAKLLEGSMLASVAITAAEPSGLWGMMQEGFANASSIISGANSTSGIVKDIVSDIKTAEGRTIAQDSLKARLKGLGAAEVAAAAIAALGEIAQIADAKGGADAAGYKQWVYASAEKVANAASEGGFLGFGGVKVSDKERATLAQLASALKLG